MARRDDAWEKVRDGEYKGDWAGSKRHGFGIMKYRTGSFVIILGLVKKKEEETDTTSLRNARPFRRCLHRRVETQ